jgi:hypothetical protein
VKDPTALRDTEVSFDIAKELCGGAIAAFSIDDSRTFGPTDNVMMAAVCILRLALFLDSSHLPVKWNNRIASRWSIPLVSYIRYQMKGRDHLVESYVGLSIM